MRKANSNWTRRKFLKTAGAAGIGSVLTPISRQSQAAEDLQTMPRRPFGKTGITVPILGFGGSLNTAMSPLLLRQAIEWGVTYWDTANSYMGGHSEKGIGKYFAKYPADRQKIFLVTKSYAWSVADRANDLNVSLERMNTDYVDLFFVHSVRDISDLDDQTKSWAKEAKAQGKIRLFGFSTHSNMEECLLQAADMDWIDGIMMTYNYRLMHTDRMRRAVDACVQAGIGLTAMKTQGGGQVQTDTSLELKLAGRFLAKGFTDAQAKLKAVWENPQIASICSEMPNMSILMSNVAAAMNKTTLSARDTEMLRQYARATGSGYCTGCADICESAVAGQVPIGDVMRYLMYAHSYGDLDRASSRFKKIPQTLQQQMRHLDYSAAEQKCPQRMAIGRLMRAAVRELS